jgi:hypothetical protein
VLGEGALVFNPKLNHIDCIVSYYLLMLSDCHFGPHEAQCVCLDVQLVCKNIFFVYTLFCCCVQDGCYGLEMLVFDKLDGARVSSDESKCSWFLNRVKVKLSCV